MGGFHHAYNARGRQFGDPPLWGSIIKKGPRKPHRHKISHGYWELNPNYTESEPWTRWRWVHHPEHQNAHVPSGVADVVDKEVITDVLGIFNPRPSGGFTPPPPSTGFNPMLLLGAGLVIFLMRKK